MFGKKIDNPEIEQIDNMFGDRIVTAIHGHSSSFVNLGTKEFIALAKFTRSIIFKEKERGTYPYMYFVFGPDGVMYFTEIEQKVKVK